MQIEKLVLNFTLYSETIWWNFQKRDRLRYNCKEFHLKVPLANQGEGIFFLQAFRSRIPRWICSH